MPGSPKSPMGKEAQVAPQLSSRWLSLPRGCGGHSSGGFYAGCSRSSNVVLISRLHSSRWLHLPSSRNLLSRLKSKFESLFWLRFSCSSLPRSVDYNSYGHILDAQTVGLFSAGTNVYLFCQSLEEKLYRIFGQSYLSVW